MNNHLHRGFPAGYPASSLRSTRGSIARFSLAVSDCSDFRTRGQLGIRTSWRHFRRWLQWLPINAEKGVDCYNQKFKSKAQFNQKKKSYFGWNFWYEGVSVINDGILVLSIPKIQLYTTTSAKQCLAIDLHWWLTSELMTYEIKMARITDVMKEPKRHK